MRSSSLLLALVPLVGLVELALHGYFATRAPGFADYAELAPALLRLKQPGVPVVVAPAWAEPLVRQAAPAAFPLTETARSDDSSFGSFLEVSLLGQSAPELVGFPVESSQKSGPFQLNLRQNTRPEPRLFDFVSAVDEGLVEVFTEVDGERAPCSVVDRAHGMTGGLHGHVAFPRHRYECLGGRVVAVTVTEDQQYRPRRCVLAQLPDAGSVVLRFSSVPRSAHLVGFAGFSYFLERDAQTDQIELQAREGKQALGDYRVAGARGWQRFELTRPPTATPATVEVALRRLARSSSDVCFALEAR